MAGTMLAARMHHVGEPMSLDEVPVPEPGPHDVRVSVRACNIVPNLANILQNWTTWFPQNPLPALPAIFGLDPAGVVDSVGSDVHGFAPGDRVYVNPGRYCGDCLSCRRGEHNDCTSYAFSGYFGFTATAPRLLDRYPYGGLAEYMIAPQYSLVKLPDSISFEQAARFGYLGTGYAALRKARVGTDTTVLINGISGTLGLGVALLSLAMGATTVLGTGRDRDLLARVEALSPGRIRTFSTLDGAIDSWVHRTLGGGVDVHIDALGPGAPHEPFQQGLKSLRRGGRAVNIGATAGEVPIDVHHIMDQQLQLLGSCWFSAGEGQAMAAMADAGLLDLSIFEHITYPLTKVNEAIGGVAARNGGFSNFLITPAQR
ncbi:alcohol dehydrogenase catalytic domain-containing protein [Nocardia carnea]|uniref:alcohol dehydrogenase catalytic domain-containing protein n=1 Tax=Nocardia carnea TaxID=37328 RepID=UPI00245677C5|nr:alcohol dehydrogenase catalytic domain-containing protein [Nocardia carnea]